MKKIIRHIFIIGFILIATSLSVFATCNNGVKDHGHSCFGGDGGTSEAAAPLDGGLLSILGAAGISYYVIRKKKKKDQ